MSEAQNLFPGLVTVLAGLVLSGGPRVESGSVPSPTSRDSLHSLACGPSLYFQRTSLASAPIDTSPVFDPPAFL